MATEEEAREAADGEEIQVEVADLGTTHLHMNLDDKLSSHGQIKDEAKIMDSTEGLLKVIEDQVLEKAPSVIEIPPEDTPECTSSSLNGHMKGWEISNEKSQENGQKDTEQVEASSNGISTDQSNNSNGEEAIDSSGHAESTKEDTSLLKHENEYPKEHYQQDVEGAAVEDKMVHKEDTLQTDEPTVDAQQGQNLEPAKVTEDTQHASMSCIPHEEVVAEAPSGVQAFLEPNVDDSDALPDTSDGNTETDPAKVDKESCPEDEYIAEHTNEVIKLGDQPSKQTDDVDAEVVQEEVPKSKNTDVPEDMIKTEQADEPMNGDQEQLNQEPTEEIRDTVHGKYEETSSQSNVPPFEEKTPEHDATREPDLDVQEVQNQGLADAKEVDTKKTVQRNSVAFEDATPEDGDATIEPSSEIQHLNNVESEEIKGLEDAKHEVTSNESNVTIVEDAAQGKEAAEDIQPEQGLEEEEAKSTGTVEASNQPHADVLNNLAEEDSVPACQPQVIELEEEVKDTGVTETQEITQQSHVAASEELVTEDNSMAVESRNDDIQQTQEQGSVEVKDTEASETQEICHERTISASEEDSVEDDVTREGPTSDAQEVGNIESAEEINNNTADNIVEASNVATVEEADQENNMLPSEDVPGQQTRELEPEEIQSTEPVETEEASDQRHPALLNDPSQEDSIPSDMPKTEPTTEVMEIEATRTEAPSQESKVSISEEPASEENIITSEITCDAQEVNNLEPEDVEGNKDTGTKEISDQSSESNVASLEEMATEDNTATLTDASIQTLQEQEAVEFRDTEATEPNGISPTHIVSASEESAPQDNVMAESSPDSQAESLESVTVTEDTRDLKSTDATAEEETPEKQEFEAPVHTPPVEEPELEETKNIDNQMDAAVLENPTHEDNPAASESLVMDSAEVSSSDEGQEMPQSEVTQSEDHETEENMTESDPKILEPEHAGEIRDSEATEPRSISQQTIVSSPEEDVTAKEPVSDIEEVQTEEPELIEEHNDVKAAEISNQSSGTIVAETAQENLESATVTEETKDDKSTDAIAEEETPEEHVQEFEAPVDIPPVEEPESEETKNTELVEVHDNVTTNDLPAEEVKDTEATEIQEIHNESGDLNEDFKSNVALADEAAPDEDAKAKEATADIPQTQEPELEEIKNSEPVEVEDNIIASDLPEEEIKDTGAMETEVAPDESTSAKISELANDVKSNVAPEEAAPEEHVIATEATTDVPPPQEPELEEIKNPEPAEVEENIPANDQSAEENKATEAMETEAINKSIDANSSELTEDVKRNFVLEDEAAHEEHPTSAETTVLIPREQEPELEEIKNTEPVEVKENISAGDLPVEEVKLTEAMETEVISESTDANISEPTEDVKRNVALADEAAPEENIIPTEETVDIPRAQEPELEEVENSEHVEVEENISADGLPGEEVKDTETMETEVINDSTDANITELTEDVALADGAVPDVHVDIPPVEEAKLTEATETEVISESTDANISEPTEDAKRNVALADEAAPEEHVIPTEATVDIPRAQESELEEVENSEHAEVEENISADGLPGEEVKDTETMETEAINDSTDANITELTEDVALADEAVPAVHLDIPPVEEAAPEEHVILTEATVDIPRAQEPEVEEVENSEHVEVEENISADGLPGEEVKDTETMETEAINDSTDANITELTEDVALADEAVPDVHVDIPQVEEGKLIEAMETEVISESTDANISEPTEDVKRNVALADEAAPEENIIPTEETVDISRAQEPELEEVENSEHVEVEENISADGLPGEEVKDTETMETEAINDSTDANITALTEDVALADEAVPDVHVDIPPVEEAKLTEAMETEVISESTDAISEPTEDAKRNVALADEAAPEEHVIPTEATVDIPRAQEPEVEEVENSEHVEVEENISADGLPEEEVKDTTTAETEAINDSTDANITELTEEAVPDVHVDIPPVEEAKLTEAMETEVISESTDAISEPTEDAKRNVALADEAAPEEHVIPTETTVDIPRAQEPEVEEVENSEHVEVEENISADGLPEEEVKDTTTAETEAINDSTDANITELTEEAVPDVHVDIPPVEEAKLTEAMETEVISESTDAISEPTEDAKRNVALADEAAPEEHVIPTEATVDIPRAQEPELEEVENSEHVEVEENISADGLPGEEVKDTETMETEEINDSTDANITELTEDVALADKAVPDVHVDIPPTQEPAVEEINITEPVEVEDIITADDVQAEEIYDTEAMETEDIHHESTDVIQQDPEQEAVEDKCTDTTENQGEPEHSIVSTVAELTPTEEKTAKTEPTQDTHVQNTTAQETERSEDVKNQEFSDLSMFCTAEVAAQESPLLGGELASDVQQVLERDSTEETRGIEALQTEDEQQHEVSNLEKPVSENNVSDSEPNVDNQVQEGKSAEVEDTEAMEMEEISIQDNIPTTENADQESSEPGTDPDLLVQSEDSKDQLEKAEETGQSNGALEEPTVEDNAANETDPLADTKEEHGLESVEGNKGIDATEDEEVSHSNQDAGLEELVSESIVATTEPSSDIQPVYDLDEAKKMRATKAIDDEETSCKKTEVATLEDRSPTDNGTSPKQKDESSDLGEKTAFTTQKGDSPTEEDVVQISGEDTVGISKNIEKIKEQPKAVIEHEEIRSGDQTNDQDDKQLHNVEVQMQVCEQSLDVSAIEQPDEDVQKVNLEQQQKEDDVIEEQTEEIQGNEHKHDESRADLTTATLLEPQSNEIATTDLNQDTDVFKPEQTETVATEMLMNEQTLHIPQGSIPSTADVKVENSTEIEETLEQENAPNNIGTLCTDAGDENSNGDDKENIEIDAAVAKPSTDEQDGKTDETINEEVGNGLAPPVEKDHQKTSDPALSNEEITENNPTVVPQNVEPRVDREENECINKASDDMQAIQASEEEIVEEVEKKQEMQNEDTDVNNDEVQTKPVDEETSELHSNDSTDNKIDDTMIPYAEMVHGRIDEQPKEIEEVEENNGFSSISEYILEQSKQNDVDQDLSLPPTVADDDLEAEQNGAEVETNSSEEMATSYTAVTDAVKFNEAIYDKASGADGELSDENLETLEENRRNLEASSVVTASGESMKEDKEHHSLALPAHSAVDGDTTEQASSLEMTERGLLFPEKPLPTEPEEHEESQTTKEQDEDGTHEQETGETDKEEKEAEQSDLPVSNFLMNLIMGKESTKPDRNLEFETEKKQEETTKDDSCLITSQQEEILVPIPTENKLDNKFIFEQGKHNLEGSEETHDFKLESDEELSRNIHGLEAPVCQTNVQGEISSELAPGGPGLMTEVGTRDAKLGETCTDSVCQEHMEAATQTEEGSLKSNIDDSTNPKASQEDTLEEGRTDLRHESLPEDKTSDAVTRQTLLSTEPDKDDENKLSNDTDDLQSPLSTKREDSTESSIIEAESTSEAELENEVEKEENKQHTGVATEGQIENLHDNLQKGTEATSDEQMAEITEPVMDTEINLVHEKDISAGSECEDEKQSNKLLNSKLDNSEKALEIQSDGSSLHINQDKQDGFVGDQIVMEKNNLLDKPGESNLQGGQETEIGQKSPKESDGGDQNCLAIREPVIKEENVNRTVERDVQEVNIQFNEEQETFNSRVQEHNLDVVSAKEAPEVEENFVEMAKPELSTDEEQCPKEEKSNMAGEKTCDENTKDEEEAKNFTDEATTKIEEQGAVQKVSHNQTRDLNVVLPTGAPGTEESFVDIKTPEFSTDEEQSPKKDESNMADEKTNGDEEAKNSTDEAPMRIEEREAGQKASPKKHNILSGVGSKVKHQLAKVKKAIIGKPGHTKSELPKS